MFALPPWELLQVPAGPPRLQKRANLSSFISSRNRSRNQQLGCMHTETPTLYAYADTRSKASADPGGNYAHDYQEARLYHVTKRSWFTEQPDLEAPSGL